MQHGLNTNKSRSDIQRAAAIFLRSNGGLNWFEHSGEYEQLPRGSLLLATDAHLDWLHISDRLSRTLSSQARSSPSLTIYPGNIFAMPEGQGALVEELQSP